MLLLSGLMKKEKEARLKMLRVLHSGKGLEKLRLLVQAQGGDVKRIKDTELFPKSGIAEIITAPKDGYVTSILAEKIGSAAMLLGAGRMKKNDIIDHSAGIMLHKKVGDKVMKSEGIATLYTHDIIHLKEATEKLLLAFAFSTKKPSQKKLVLGKVSKKGVTTF